MSILITEEMQQAAQEEARKRDPFINHHFELSYMTPAQRDIIGFLGEFACKEALGLDWRAGIREDYVVPDQGDILDLNGVVDIKTETVPFQKLMRLVRKEIGDDDPYGRRLINQDQVSLLQHYDYVVWGAFSRPDGRHPLKWYDLGYLESAYILAHYTITRDAPFGGTYPEPCLNVRTSELKSLLSLKRKLGIA